MANVVKIINKFSVFLSYLWILGILCFQSVCEAEYIVAHSPKHTTFLTDAGTIDLSEVPKVLVSSFGLDLNQDLKWKGLSAWKLFSRPKAQVVLSVEGLDQETLNIPHVAKYSLNNDVAEVDTEAVRRVMQSTLVDGSLIVDYNEYPRIYDLRTKFPKLFSNLPSNFRGLKALFSQESLDTSVFGSLNVTNDKDLEFLGEIYMLKSIVDSLVNNAEVASDNRPDFLHMRVRGMQGLEKVYGRDSVQYQDALKLLQSTVIQVTKELCTIYSDNVVVHVVVYSNHDVISRKSRSLQQAAAEPAAESDGIKDTLNVAPVYAKNYSAMFNLILWTSVLLILVILAVAYSVWFMDPGRDSIIYRMTSQRMKRD